MKTKLLNVIQRLEATCITINKNKNFTAHRKHHPSVTPVHDTNVIQWTFLRSGRILFFFMSSFNRSIHLSLGLPLGQDPSIRVFRTYFAMLSSSLRCTWPNHDSRFFIRKVFIGFICAFSRMITFLMWYFLHSKISFEMSLILLEAIIYYVDGVRVSRF